MDKTERDAYADERKRRHAALVSFGSVLLNINFEMQRIRRNQFLKFFPADTDQEKLHKYENVKEENLNVLATT